MKVIFAGTPEFAAVALQAIHQAGFEVPLVLTQPDRPAGRGMQMQASAVKQFALQHNIPVAQPVSLKLDGKYPDQAQAAHELLRNTPHDVMVVAAYGLILPVSALSIPPMGCINIHGSLLPRWRGAAPIHRAIESGDTETGITIMQMDEGLDTGAMLSIQSLAIGANATTASLHDQLADLGGSMIVQTLKKLAQAPLVAQQQPEQGVCYAAKISKEEAALDFNQTAQNLDRKIRAFNPFPGAHFNLNGTTVKIWHAEIADEENLADIVTNAATKAATNAAPGQILAANAQGVFIQTGQGVLRISELQKPGGKRLAVAEFLKGFAITAGQFVSI